MAKGLSGYIDALMNRTIEQTLHSAMPMDVPFLSKYPDFFALFLVLVVTLLLSVGVKLSSSLINVCTSINMLTISIIVISGITKGKDTKFCS